MSKKVYIDGIVDGELTIGAYTLPEVDGTNGQVLKTNGSGVIGWQDDTSVGVTTLASLTDVAGVDYTGGTILVGDGVDSFDQVAMSGDVTINTIGQVDIVIGAVNLNKIETIAVNTVLGNVTGPGDAIVEEITIDNDISTVPGDDSELASSDAIKTYVDNQISAVIGKYTDDFVIADWAGAGPYTLTYAAGTHGLTTDKYLTVHVYEDGTPNTEVIPQIDVADNGDVTITSNSTLDGHVVIIG